jgi:hypothetical protein
MIWLFIYLCIVLIWTLICNQRTCKQRSRLIDLQPLGELFESYSKEYNKVSYDSHLWRLITFRNPKYLYGPLHQSIWWK